MINKRHDAHEKKLNMLSNESWMLYFDGGGWCYSPEDCAIRSEGKAGSSATWPRENDSISFGNLVNKCCYCTKFCRFHRVFLKSCDGHAFAGNTTFRAPGLHQELRSVGQLILRTVLDMLLSSFGLRDAKSILVAGCSAGGMSALLNAERIRTQLRAAGVEPMRFKVAAISALFFPWREPLASSSPVLLDSALLPTTLSPFEEQMRAVVQLGNISLPSRCAAQQPAGQAWRCVLGLGLVEALPPDLPAYVYQSRLDLWQTHCIVAAGRSRYFQLNCTSSPAWQRCLGWMTPLTTRSRCTQWQWETLRQYEEANDAALSASEALRRPGFGSFIHSCHDHCVSTQGLIQTGATLRPGMVNDSINLRESLQLWFVDWSIAGHRQTPAWENTHMGCWNHPVQAMVPGKANAPWCRRPECAGAVKLHKDDRETQRKRIRTRGWKWLLDES